ncbi:MAG: nicotinamide-nucleotide amidohydrolase family protein [Candidatus Omnitrophica bacterium]|nr:nicotinamide-nucleotide amidohydrolase family protein [Candidatus Omnitrophota bacterium]
MAQHIVSQIHKLLIKKNYTLATAESCTGGLLAKLLTDLSGSSKYFLLGIISYSNQAKTKTLQIPSKLISKKGAVSREVALKMADSVKKLAKADFGIGITGVAGPSGGSKERAVGTVFIAISANNQKTCGKFQFKGSRDTIRRLAALKSLRLLKDQL